MLFAGAMHSFAIAFLYGTALVKCSRECSLQHTVSSLRSRETAVLSVPLGAACVLFTAKQASCLTITGVRESG
ncbi:MAG: hypothetical protein IKD04_08185 [Clostridia bacterium]|nr:hypothetical protein [Clostridia bacterium]